MVKPDYGNELRSKKDALWSEKSGRKFINVNQTVAGLANPAPARPCVGRWPFSPVLAAGQTLQSAIMQKTFNAKTPRRKGATQNNSIRKPGNHEIFSMIPSFLVS